VATVTTAAAQVLFDNEIITFDAAYGPFDRFLYFRTDKTGSDTFDITLPKDRPGDYFSDDVTFSSPNWSAPEQVLWGWFDGPDGGIGPRPAYVGLLRLTFRVPVVEVGFRNPGMQPGITVRYFDVAGALIAEQVGVVSSFLGAASTVPIARIDIEGSGGNRFHITAVRFNQAPQPPPDADGDSVPDSLDECASTPVGSVVNGACCSLPQLIPCSGPSSGVTWKNHGRYVMTFVHHAQVFQAAGLISEEDKDALIADAAVSSCGK
jgi:hypothetical protein